MSEADTPNVGQDSVDAKFARAEQELAKETSVLALMKEQMTSMFGYGPYVRRDNYSGTVH